MNDTRWMGLVAGLLMVWACTGCRLAPQAIDTKTADAQVATPPQAGDPRTADLGGGVKLELVWCPPGTFTMGLPVTEDQHQVTLTKGFWLGKYEVTQAEYESVMGKNPSHFKGVQNPVEQVSWKDAAKFCRKLTKQERAAGRLPDGNVYRLPTEAEWEYAARGGTQSKGFAYAGSNTLDEVAWYEDNSGGKTHPAGQKKPNELGLYDMSGNVWEWCHDWIGDHGSDAVTNPDGASTGQCRVGRGGSWFDSASFCRAARRDGSPPSSASRDLGFRVSLAAPVQ